MPVRSRRASRGGRPCAATGQGRTFRCRVCRIAAPLRRPRSLPVAWVPTLSARSWRRPTVYRGPAPVAGLIDLSVILVGMEPGNEPQPVAEPHHDGESLPDGKPHQATQEERATRSLQAIFGGADLTAQ